MSRSFLLAVLVLCELADGTAQDLHGYALNAYVRGHIPLDMGGGNTANVCDRNFGYDSSYVELLFTGPDQTTTGASSNRLVTPLTFLNHGAKLDDGILACGSSYAYLPMLFKAGNTGDVQWCKGFNNLQNGQDQVIRIVPRGDDYTVYTYPGGTYAHDVYRIEGEGSGTTFSGIDIGAAANFRVYEATPTADPLVQLVCGTGNDDADPSHLRSMLMKTDANGAQWMMLYEMGTTGVQVQDLYGVIVLADGNYLCTGYYTTGGPNFQGVLIKVDQSGAVIWCKQLADVSGGLFLNHAVELASGELLAAGVNASYQGLLIKLDASGTPLSTKLFAEDRLLSFHRDGAQLSVHGPYTQVQLDADGNGCGLVDATNVTATAYTPVVTSITVGNTAFTPTATDITTLPRTPALQWNSTCTWSAIDEVAQGAAALRPYPVPTTALVMLGKPGTVSPSERVRVLTITGRLLRELPYGAGIDLGSDAAGAYVVEIPAGGRRVLVMKE